MKTKEYIGILLGGIYGIVYRLLCENNDNQIFDFNIFSISFIWILPIVIGVLPILIANKEIQNSKSKQVLYPIASVLLFFIITLATRLEDLVCILILTLPFIMVAGISGLIVGEILKRSKSNKLFSIVLLPFLIIPLESKLSDAKKVYQVETKIIIEASKEKVWDHLIEVPEISEAEYEYGFYNYIGIPRPVKSELQVIEGEQYRIGYFTDHLQLVEKISQIDTLNFVEFEIVLEKSVLRDLPTDKHILQSSYFKFDKISYELVVIDANNIELRLDCKYSIDSKMNWYANFWAEKIIRDFEIKLLNVLKTKIENEKIIEKKKIFSSPNNPKSQINSIRLHPPFLRHRMLPMMLHSPFHDQQRTML